MPVINPIRHEIGVTSFQDSIISLKSGIANFIKRNVILITAISTSTVTTIFVPPDIKYFEYFDFKTLSCLFCILGVVCALRNIKFFTFVARHIVDRFKTTRGCYLALCYITFIGSMFIANDMALLTFLPLGSLVLINTGKQKHMAFLFIMQNISANLGGMLTPFGNPQNLYLYSAFNIPTGEFMFIMAIPFTVAVIMISICCLCVKNEDLSITESYLKELPRLRLVIYLMLFVLSIAIVFRGIPYWIGLLVIPLVLFIFDREALRMVDYPLLMTFIAFFIFSGNMSRMETVRNLLSGLLEKSTLLFSILSCQIISNVPSAILLSHFTDNYRELLLGVNIGGTGTLIASLASLITFREYQKYNQGKSLRYIGKFTLYNLLFLIFLTLTAYITINI
ncbi:MAG: SLC13 family permease [Eubacteriales bacterium]